MPCGNGDVALEFFGKTTTFYLDIDVSKDGITAGYGMNEIQVLGHHKPYNLIF